MYEERAYNIMKECGGGTYAIKVGDESCALAFIYVALI